MAKCTYCGREADQPTKYVGGYEILECCTDCEEEISKTETPDPDKKMYVNVYSITREYGGPEEGGWWYNNYQCLEVYPVRESNAEEVKDRLLEEYADIKEGNIYSVLGGTDLAVYIEDKPAESETRERPHYE